MTYKHAIRADKLNMFIKKTDEKRYYLKFLPLLPGYLKAELKQFDFLNYFKMR